MPVARTFRTRPLAAATAAAFGALAAWPGSPIADGIAAGLTQNGRTALLVALALLVVSAVVRGRLRVVALGLACLGTAAAAVIGGAEAIRMLHAHAARDAALATGGRIAWLGQPAAILPPFAMPVAGALADGLEVANLLGEPAAAVAEAGLRRLDVTAILSNRPLPPRPYLGTSRTIDGVVITPVLGPRRAALRVSDQIIRATAVPPRLLAETVATDATITTDDPGAWPSGRVIDGERTLASLLAEPIADRTRYPEAARNGDTFTARSPMNAVLVEEPGLVHMPEGSIDRASGPPFSPRVLRRDGPELRRHWWLAPFDPPRSSVALPSFDVNGPLRAIPLPIERYAFAKEALAAEADREPLVVAADGTMARTDPTGTWMLLGPLPRLADPRWDIAVTGENLGTVALQFGAHGARRTIACASSHACKARLRIVENDDAALVLWFTGRAQGRIVVDTVRIAHGRIPAHARAVAAFPDRLAKGDAVATDRPFDPAIVARCGAAALQPLVVDGWAQGYFAHARLAGCREMRATPALGAFAASFGFLVLAAGTQGLARVRFRRASRGAPAYVRPTVQTLPRAVYLTACCLFGAAGIAVVGAAVHAFVVDVPLYDEWLWAPIVAHAFQGGTTFGELWAQQNVHRSIVPTAIAVLAARIAGWHEGAQAALSIAFATATYAIVVGALDRTRRSALAAAAAAATLVYSFAQMENWLWGFQLSWFLANALVCGAAGLAPRRTRAAFAGAIVCAVLASYTLIVGTLAWPLVGVALLLRRRFAAFGIWTACAAITGIGYLLDFHPPSGQLAATHATPDLLTLGFVTAYLGAPLAIGLPLAIAQLLGFGAAAALVVGAVRTRASARAETFTLIGAFAIAAAVLEAIGRASYGAEAALTSRYTTIGIDVWLALVGLASFARAGIARAAVPLTAALVIVCTLGTTYAGFASGSGLRETALRMRAVLRAGGPIHDPSTYTIRPDRFARDLELLREAHLMPFDGGR